MDKDLFERLLYEEESATLDFKEEQYRFVRATEDEKSEILKDILGFVNAWRRSEAYILIGVEEIRGGRSKITGIPEDGHLDEHSLQQFVNNLTNQPVHFHYEAFGVEEKRVGIIRIEKQIRPIYLKRDYGKLSKERVYVRRGSSTDPTKPASIEEIAQMRLGITQTHADLRVEFCHLDSDDALGSAISLETEYCEMPVSKMIPDLKPPPQQVGPLGLSLPSINLLNRPNVNYFREIANYIYMHRLFEQVRLVVENIGQVGANDVQIEITVPTNIDAIVTDIRDLPELPEPGNYGFNTLALKGIKPPFRQDPGEVSIIKNSVRSRIEINCLDLQPGRRVWSNAFCIGKRSSGELSLSGSIFAENLPRPKDFELTVKVQVAKTTMSVDDIVSVGSRRL